VFSSYSKDGNHVAVVEKPLAGGSCLCAILMDLEVIDVLTYSRSVASKVIEQDKLVRINSLIERCLNDYPRLGMLQDLTDDESEVIQI
jgi:hypothetical protein